MSKKLTPYEGPEKYIFVSYSHKNEDVVFPILYSLDVDGYNIWYDEGIHAGSEWVESIANHIDNAHLFLAFVSPEYIASSHCKDEIHYARDLDIESILIYITEVELPGGMKMRFNRRQAIFYYKYSSEEDFLNVLYSSNGIEVCNKKGNKNNIKENADERILASITEEHEFVVEKMDNGSIIEHYIRDGVWDGPFTEKTVNGGVYKGTYVNSHIEGDLTYVDRNNNEFVCEYRNNNWNGDGVYKSSKGVLTGHWTGGKLDNNYGVYKYNNGSIYEGEVRKFMRDGKGVMHFPENDIRLKAEFKEDIIIGKVTITFPNGDFYCGEWKDLIEGSGVFYSKNCDIPELTFVQYDGLWRNSLMSGGRSELVFVSSNKKKYKYIGNFISGTANGYGYLYECDFKGKEKKLIYDVWKNNRIENESKSNSRIREAEDLLAVSTDYINRIISTIPKKSDIAVL